MLLVLVVVAGAALAQNSRPAPQDAGQVFSSTQFLTEKETWAAGAVLVFGALMALFGHLLTTRGALNADEAIRLVALILIVTGTMFLVVAGYSADQIAPALGLLGTVGGYLLGRSDQPGRQDGNDEARNPWHREPARRFAGIAGVRDRPAVGAATGAATTVATPANRFAGSARKERIMPRPHKYRITVVGTTAILALGLMDSAVARQRTMRAAAELSLSHSECLAKARDAVADIGLSPKQSGRAGDWVTGSDDAIDVFIHCIFLDEKSHVTVVVVGDRALTSYDAGEVFDQIKGKMKATTTPEASRQPAANPRLTPAELAAAARAEPAARTVRMSSIRRDRFTLRNNSTGTLVFQMASAIDGSWKPYYLDTKRDSEFPLSEFSIIAIATSDEPVAPKPATAVSGGGSQVDGAYFYRVVEGAKRYQLCYDRAGDRWVVAEVRGEDLCR